MYPIKRESCEHGHLCQDHNCKKIKRGQITNFRFAVSFTFCHPSKFLKTFKIKKTAMGWECDLECGKKCA